LRLVHLADIRRCMAIPNEHLRSPAPIATGGSNGQTGAKVLASLLKCTLVASQVAQPQQHMAGLPGPLQCLIQLQASLEVAARVRKPTFGGDQPELQQDERTLGTRILRRDQALQKCEALPQQLLAPRNVTLQPPEVGLPGA